ncbi:DUF5050 domain-containing protein [Clostridium tyrobutyricum]|jgi:hypothetical protein|uniref:DUF5050 domain-containing protein n=1 Tax=Clostridium tyrobutyricum TaxID=1519 RepID=UPI001C391ED4|nr:DUF5050 domain-containing protein [Clostridium tyrobutyricum]MBV4415231.1 DUF5050 domain-containing protein [Clostridium tyrobutyricum]MBV4420902.1 DUF5050 domain-containing protein [Clostridium tyrobutyricum]MBV4424011.1 DUF5050 domain-containing protein [Clostridium tyrobutyricum]MBV4426888.1 DUF5050 domain-containing protein [Clostridium tyrobutyricum]MBV4429795.1 DUF5050 domain-containing protein [Clostridium tyrobutyricum]
MKDFVKNMLLIIVFFAVLILVGCGVKKEEIDKFSVPKYSNVIVLESNKGKKRIFNIENDALNENNSYVDILDLNYNLSKSVYVYLLSKKGNENKIQIINKNSKIELKDFFSASDIKLNQSGDKIAFRIYKTDSTSSAQGMKIYDIKNNKYINLKSNVLVSGNLYAWLDENRIIYYGSKAGEKNSTKIYAYNIENNKESQYYDNINGYCMYVFPVNNNILYVSGIGDNQFLYYYDKTNNTTRVLDKNITGIYKSIKDDKRKKIFFIAKQRNNVCALYEFSYENLTLNRITYDFPKFIGASYGIAEDRDENIYFTGYDTEENENNMDVYMYNIKQKSINLLSNHESLYKIYGSEN